MVDKICNMFTEEDIFDTLVQFLTKSVQVRCVATLFFLNLLKLVFFG